MNPLAKQRNNLFNFKSFNKLKKDQTKIKIFKNSSFDSSFNSVQSLNTNLSHLLLLEHKPKDQQSKGASPFSNYEIEENAAPSKNKFKMRGVGSYPKFSAILRAIRSIRLNRDEWKLIRYLNQKKKKIRSSPSFESPSLKTSVSNSPSCLWQSSLQRKGAGFDWASISSTNSSSNTFSLPNNLSLSTSLLPCNPKGRSGQMSKGGEGLSPLREEESKGVGSTTFLKESNLKSYIFKNFNNKKEGIGLAKQGRPLGTGGVFSKLNPKEKKKLSIFKKELKKFASLLPPVVRGLETPLLNRVAPSSSPHLSPLLRGGA